MTDWVQLGTDVMRAARDEQGLSIEAMGRKLYVSSKTYERWQKRGAVPREHLARVAELLNLEIEALPPRRVRVEATENDPGLLVAELVATREEMQALRRTLEDRLPLQRAAGSP